MKKAFKISDSCVVHGSDIQEMFQKRPFSDRVSYPANPPENGWYQFKPKEFVCYLVLDIENPFGDNSEHTSSIDFLLQDTKYWCKKVSVDTYELFWKFACMHFHEKFFHSLKEIRSSDFFGVEKEEVFDYAHVQTNIMVPLTNGDIVGLVNYDYQLRDAVLYFDSEKQPEVHRSFGNSYVTVYVFEKR